MVGAIVHQLTRKMTDSQIQDSAFAPYFVDHTAGVYPTAASGFPWTAASMAVKGDPIADLTEDLAAEAALRYTAIGFCQFLASRKVVVAQGFLGFGKGDPYICLGSTDCDVV
jgi:Mn-containing catalase